MTRPGPRSRRSRIAAALVAVAAVGCVVACHDTEGTTTAAATPSASPVDITNPFAGASTAPDPSPPDPIPVSSHRPAKRISVALTGDVLVHTGVWESAERDAARRGETLPDFRPMFAGIAPQISGADLAICHLETPLSRPRGPYLNYPVFSAPPTVLDGLVAAGYDGCTTASNHSVDQGFAGIVRTIAALDRRGLQHTGTFATRRAAGRPLVFDVHGVRVGLISMTFGTNGLPVTVPWSVNLIDLPRAIAQARAMHRHGVDIVMVAVHAGDEYSHTPSAQQRSVFRALARSPYVDLVYGHHSHVVEPVERVAGKWVIYGLGNLVAQQETTIPDTYRGVIAHVTFVRRPDGSYRAERPTYSGTVITNPHVYGVTRVLDATTLLHRAGVPASLRTLAAQSAHAARVLASGSSA